MEHSTDKSSRNTAKQQWNAAHYSQIKVSVDKNVAAAFKKACFVSNVSMAKALTAFMFSFSHPDVKTKNLFSRNDIVSLATKKQRRTMANFHINGLQQIKAAQESARDNIPLNLQNSAVFDIADNTIDLLDQAIDLISDAFL